MQAHGLKRRIQYEYGVRSQVFSEGETEALRIISALEPEQLKKLDVFVGANGWDPAYRVEDEGTDMFLVLVPREPREEVSS